MSQREEASSLGHEVWSIVILMEQEKSGTETAVAVR